MCMRLFLLLFGLFALVGALSFLKNAGAAPPEPASPQVFSSPINAACVRVTPGTCKLHVDPFTIQVAPSQRLQAFQLQANGQLLYDFRTDTSNPPSGSYSPSLVKRDFAAVCGRTYTVNLVARDSGDTGFLNAGQAEDIVCPKGIFSVFLPLSAR